MRRSLHSIRRGLLGLAFLGSLGFGASQALAAPESGASALRYCNPQGIDPHAICNEVCPCGGWCNSQTFRCDCKACAD